MFQTEAVALSNISVPV